METIKSQLKKSKLGKDQVRLTSRHTNYLVINFEFLCIETRNSKQTNKQNNGN